VQVLADDGNYYPAGIYLGPNENTNLPVIRAIDADTADLINRADRLATAQVSFVQPAQSLIQPMGTISAPPGNIASTNAPVHTLYAADAVPAILEVKIGPPMALRAGGGWQLSDDDTKTLHTNAASTVPIPGGTDPKIGFVPIQNRTFGKPFQTNVISVMSGQLAIVDFEYLSAPPNPVLTFTNDSQGVIILLSHGYTNYTYEVDYATDPVNGNWTFLNQQTIGAPANSLIFRDAPATKGNRFYRAQWITSPVSQQTY
jgi:hypothetical protein